MTMTPNILALDVHYEIQRAIAAAVGFCGWDALQSNSELVVVLDQVADYQPGEFYRRELPCLLALVDRLDALPDFLLIDGYVWLDGNQRPGLGAKLYEALDKQVPIIGVATTRFHAAVTIEVLRGTSRSPLFVTAVGVDTELAATWIQKMAGSHRIPTLLRQVDQLCRNYVS